MEFKERHPGKQHNLKIQRGVALKRHAKARDSDIRKVENDVSSQVDQHAIVQSNRN